MKMQQVKYVIFHLAVLLRDVPSGEKGLECDQGCLKGMGSLCHGLAMEILTKSRIKAELRGEGHPLSITVTSQH